MMRSDFLFQNNVARRGTSYLKLHTRSYKDTQRILGKKQRAHTHRAGYHPIVPAARPDSGVGLTSHTHTGPHAHTHATSIATGHVTLVLYAQPFLSLSLIHVFHPDRCQRLLEPGCRLMIRVGRMEAWTGSTLRSSLFFFGEGSLANCH